MRKCLEIRHLKNFEAMRVLFSNFTIMNVEFRCGNITIEDVKEIPEIYNLFEFNRHRIVAGEMVLDEAQKRLLPIFFKYNEQELIKNILDFNTIADILESGDYQAKIITSELNSHKYFMDPVESPAWLNVISFDHLEDDVVKEAIKKLHHQFTNRQIEDIGEMIHMFHGLFLLTQNRELEYSYEELLIEIKKYIDDLLHSNRLPASPLSPHPFDDDIYERSYNHGYWVSNEYRDYVDDAISYLKDKRVLALQSKYNNFKSEILESLENDIEKFKFLFLGKGSEVGKYSQISILNIISPDEFIMTWFSLPRHLWDIPRMVLNSRFRNPTPDILIYEKQWLFELFITMKIEALSQDGLERFRIERLLPYSAIRQV